MAVQPKTKVIPGFDGCYFITPDGKIWSKPRIDRLNRKVKGGWLKQRQDSFGRFDVSLQVSGKSKRFLVHRLVLETFVGPCPDGMVACHNNGDPADNRMENLRWDTSKANSKDAVVHGTCALLGSKVSRPKGTQHHRCKLSELDIKWIRCLRNAGILLKDLAEVYKVTESLISAICRKRVWKHVSIS